MPFFLIKIEDVKADQEAQSIWHYRQRAKINMGRERMTVTKRNAIIVRRRDTLRRIVGKMWRHGREGTMREKRAE